MYKYNSYGGITGQTSPSMNMQTWTQTDDSTDDDSDRQSATIVFMFLINEASE